MTEDSIYGVKKQTRMGRFKAWLARTFPPISEEERAYVAYHPYSLF
jgi:hypothetical protein